MIAEILSAVQLAIKTSTTTSGVKSVVIAPNAEAISNDGLLVFPANLSFPAVVVCDGGQRVEYLPSRYRRIVQTVVCHVLVAMLKPDTAMIGVGTVKGIAQVADDVDEVITFAPATTGGSTQAPALGVAGATMSALIRSDPAMDFVLEDKSIVWKRMVFEVVVHAAT